MTELTYLVSAMDAQTGADVLHPPQKMGPVSKLSDLRAMVGQYELNTSSPGVRVQGIPWNSKTGAPSPLSPIKTFALKSMANIRIESIRHGRNSFSVPYMYCLDESISNLKSVYGTYTLRNQAWTPSDKGISRMILELVSKRTTLQLPILGSNVLWSTPVLVFRTTTITDSGWCVASLVSLLLKKERGEHE